MLFGSKDSMGLDIGSGYLKVVQLKEKAGAYELVLFDMIPLPPELIVEGSIIDSLRLVDALKELIKKARIKTKNVVIGIGGHASVSIKRIPVTEMSEEELTESIKFEAEQYVPYDIEDVYLDFQILGPREDQGQMDVLLITVKKDVVNEYMSVVKEAGLNPIIVDVNTLALGNMYEVNYELASEKNKALVNIGANTINLNILKGGASVFTRDSAMGSNLYTEALQKEFNTSYENAERLKRGEAVEGVSPQAVTPVMLSVSENIADEVIRSIEFFSSATLHEEAQEIVLSGGGALIKDFPKLLAEKAGVEVTIAEPFKNILIPKKFDTTYIEEVGPMAAVAVGLAIRRMGDR